MIKDIINLHYDIGETMQKGEKAILVRALLEEVHVDISTEELKKSIIEKIVRLGEADRRFLIQVHTILKKRQK